MTSKAKFIFFGTSPLKQGVLEELAKAGYVPERSIESEPVTPQLVEELSAKQWDVCIVASYGHKIPDELLRMPAHGVLNVHPSLLPRLRGASPIRSAILQDEKETGVSVIVLDNELDHGPLIAQKKVAVSSWPPRGRDLDALLAREGGALLAQMLPLWLTGQLEARPQNDDLATFCRSFKKEDGLLDLSADAYQNLLKIRALEGWPGTYTFFERPSTRSGQAAKRLRVQILDAHLDGNPSTPLRARKLVIDMVKPEGKKEMDYKAFLNSGARPVSQT